MGASSERQAQKSYWKEHSTSATVETMMLDSQASDIDKLERPEVLNLLGSVDELRVVELGAGIGRFTRPIAQAAASMIALDFMPNLIEQNRIDNGYLGNIDFRCGDATELELPAGSADLVFSNWLLMYLGDAEVSSLARNALRWLVPGGVCFFRESCFRQSGDKKRGTNPTHYRNPRDYFAIFDKCEVAGDDGKTYGFELIVCKSVDTYVRVKQNQNQVCWKWRKVVKPDPALFRVDRHFLDGQRYTAENIARYEFVFGRGFISPGGAPVTEEFVSRLGLRPGCSVLDVGCGVGGSAFYMARTFECFVYGVDLSVNMILTALERAAATGNGDRVSLEISDCTRREYPDMTYDAIFSRDTLVHVHDKPALFRRLRAALRPGGRMLITDYCRGPGVASPEFDTYMTQRGYDMHTVKAYQKMLEDAGFATVEAEDKTAHFGTVLGEELARLRTRKEEFVRLFGQGAYDDTEASWATKLSRAKSGEHCWGVFSARLA